MKAETAFLTKIESELYSELDRFVKLAGRKDVIELNLKQYKIWEKIFRKAKAFPDFDYAMPINIEKETFRGCHITTTAKRKQYTKRDLLKLDLTCG
jgi:hypothetical protein